MKRSKQLEPLSHDHFEGLVIAGRVAKGIELEANQDPVFWESE
jgi:hypothetical protein